uniref:Small ribosomal subunit protein uS3c n=1 Tax=Eutreptiella eupharyngea TaxID=215702 RepID=A0A977K9K7_9EUGL|nr:ribosomal protein S3 [Eutreptiella eupharyngea]UXD06301.1 ribosomal protein S3 [Eutreptiella eupharyngea]
MYYFKKLMGQKVNPLGFRIGITQDHRSHWYAKQSDYSSLLMEDSFIRSYVSQTLGEAGISLVKIQRKSDHLEIDIQAERPGLIIGRNGTGLDTFRQDLNTQLGRKFTPRDIEINVIEVTNPDSHSKLLADFISQQLESRVPFRRVVRNATQRAQKAGVKGIKIQIAGRLNGAEIARSEWVREGQVPLQTLRANIDYCSHKAHTIYGILGIKVWIYAPTTNS